MTPRLLLAVGAVGALLALIVFLLGGSEPDDPEHRIRVALAEMARAAGEKNPGGILAHVSEDFSAQVGLDRDGLRGLLFVELRRAGWTRVVLSDANVVFQSEDVADVNVRAWLARGDGPIPTDADGWELDLTFREEGGEWKVVRGAWRSTRR